MKITKIVRRSALALIAAVASLSFAGTAQAVAGLNGAFYSFASSPNNISNTLQLIAVASGPTSTFTATQVCYPNCGGQTDDGNYLSTFLGSGATGISNNVYGLGNHGLDLTGYITIATGGTQTFTLGSDDGSALWIDGTMIVNDDGIHPFQSASGSVNLSAGLHAIRIVQFENAGATALTAQLNGSYLTSSVLSTTGAVPEPATWATMLLGFGAIGAMLRRRRALAPRIA